MLKVDKVEFIDKNENVYMIKKHQLESFPLIGGTNANMITTKVWNQHGNTFIDSYMEPDDNEIVFSLYMANKNNEQQEEQRRLITNICNPLNGTVQMKVFLNTGKIYNRDITFLTAPNFPIGFENRNDVWQKVQLLFTANNPFWYAEEELLETFQNVDPIFRLPFTMSATVPIIFGNIIPANKVVNDGQVKAPLIIRIIGSCINPIIENLTTNEFIRFKNLTMLSSDELIIDTTFGQKKVLLNGENVFHTLDFSSTFFNLEVGENLIEFRDESGNNLANILAIYRNLYISI